MRPKRSSFPSGHRKPRSLPGLLDSTFKAFGLAEKIEEYAAFPHWPEIVGDEIAKIAVPEKIMRGKVLVVRVIDASWAQELTLRKPELLQALRRFEAGAILEDIRFVTGSPQNLRHSR